MKSTIVKIAFSMAVVLAAGWALPAPSQTSLQKTLYDAGNKAYADGNYRDSLRCFYQIKELTDKNGAKDEHLSILWASIAETQRVLGMLQESEASFQKALVYADKAKRAPIMSIYNNMPLLYQSLGRNTEAETMFLKSLDLARKYAKTSVLFPVNNLARLYLSWGKLEQADAYIAEGQKLAKKYPNTLAGPYSNYNIATSQRLHGQFKEAEESYKKAAQSCQTLFGKSHFYSSVVLLGLASLYSEESRYADAEQIAREVLKMREASFPSDNPDVAEAKIVLAEILADCGKYTEARELAQSALKSMETSFAGADALGLAQAKRCLGNIYRKDGRYQDAEQMLEQALATNERIVGRDHVDVAVVQRDLARVYEEEAEFTKAETLLKESRGIIEGKTGPDHPQRAKAANALAHFYLKNDKYAEGEPLLKEAYELSARVLGEGSEVTAAGARGLGQLYIKQNKAEEAIPHLQKALAIDEKLYGDKAPQLTSDLLDLASAYAMVGRNSDAEPLLKRAADIRNVLPSGADADAVTRHLTEKYTAAVGDRPVTDKWALVVGISNFKDPSINLKFAAKDATDFKNFLITSEHFKPDHVKLLTNESATRENIIKLLGEKWLGAHVGPDDLVVVYVSSHGSSSQDKTGGTNFLVAHDTNKNSLAATGIPMQWLTTIIGEQVKSNRVVLILDVCHSGSAGEGVKGLERKNELTLDPKVLKVGSGQIMLCSSLGNQISWESKNYENSVFTKRLMEALQTKKDNTSLLDAYKQLKVLVEAEVLTDRGDLQTPVLWNKNWIGKDPVLGVKTVR